MQLAPDESSKSACVAVALVSCMELPDESSASIRDALSPFILIDEPDDVSSSTFPLDLKPPGMEIDAPALSAAKVTAPRYYFNYLDISVDKGTLELRINQKKQQPGCKPGYVGRRRFPAPVAGPVLRSGRSPHYHHFQPVP